MHFRRETKSFNAGNKVEYIWIQTNEQNSLTRNAMLELEEILKSVQTDDSVRAAVLATENPKFFCNGIDAENISKTPKDKLYEEMGQIILLFNAMIQFDKPLIAEVTGYAMGGGAVLTVASDYKYMLEGKARISFTEVLMGLPLPISFIDKIKQCVLPPYLHEVCFEGANFKAKEAKEIGLITETAPTVEEIRKLTTKKLESLFRVPLTAFRKSKISFNRDLIANLKANTTESAENFNNPTVMRNLLEGMKALQEKRRPNFI